MTMRCLQATAPYTLYIYIYIHIYMYVCVCVCVCDTPANYVSAGAPAKDLFINVTRQSFMISACNCICRLHPSHYGQHAPSCTLSGQVLTVDHICHGVTLSASAAPRHAHVKTKILNRWHSSELYTRLVPVVEQLPCVPRCTPSPHPHSPTTLLPDRLSVSLDAM